MVPTPSMAPSSRSDSRTAEPSRSSEVRSTTSASLSGAAPRACSGVSSRQTVCPAISSPPCRREPNSRSGQRTAIRATPLLGPPAAELLPHGLGTAPHLHDLHPSRARLPWGQLSGDPLLVEQGQGPANGLGRRRVAEIVRHPEPPM